MPPTTDTVALRSGSGLRAAIDRAGLTLVEVAEAAEVSPSWIWHLCADRAGRRRVARHTALLIGGVVSPITRELFVLEGNSQTGQSDSPPDPSQPD